MNLNYIFLINAIHNTSVMAYKLECIAILNVKGVDQRCILWNMKEHLEKLILETFVLVIIVNGIESDRKNLMSYKVLTKSIIAQFIMMLVLINMMLNVEHH